MTVFHNTCLPAVKSHRGRAGEVVNGTCGEQVRIHRRQTHVLRRGSAAAGQRVLFAGTIAVHGASTACTPTRPHTHTPLKWRNGLALTRVLINTSARGRGLERASRRRHSKTLETPEGGIDADRYELESFDVDFKPRIVLFKKNAAYTST